MISFACAAVLFKVVSEGTHSMLFSTLVQFECRQS